MLELRCHFPQRFSCREPTETFLAPFCTSLCLSFHSTQLVTHTATAKTRTFERPRPEDTNGESKDYRVAKLSGTKLLPTAHHCYILSRSVSLLPARKIPYTCFTRHPPYTLTWKPISFSPLSSYLWVWPLARVTFAKRSWKSTGIRVTVVSIRWGSLNMHRNACISFGDFSNLAVCPLSLSLWVLLKRFYARSGTIQFCSVCYPTDFIGRIVLEISPFPIKIRFALHAYTILAAFFHKFLIFFSNFF